MEFKNCFMNKQDLKKKSQAAQDQIPLFENKRENWKNQTVYT